MLQRFHLIFTSYDNSIAMQRLFLLQWLKDVFLKYFNDWKAETETLDMEKEDQAKCCISHQTLEGIRITGKKSSSVLRNFNILYILVLLPKICIIVQAGSGPYLKYPLDYRSLRIYSYNFVETLGL